MKHKGAPGMRAKGRKRNGELGRRGKIAVSGKWSIADAGRKEMTTVVVAF
jgi:hypothetical protein